MTDLSSQALVEAIAEELRRSGVFMMEADARPYQRLVDVCWAGRSAGRMLGRHVRVETSASRSRGDGRVRVTITLDDEGA